MVDYIQIDDKELEPEAPLVSSLGVRWRDNPIAIAQGASGAPKVQDQALVHPAGYARLSNIVVDGQSTVDISVPSGYSTIRVVFSGLVFSTTSSFQCQIGTTDGGLYTGSGYSFHAQRASTSSDSYQGASAEQRSSITIFLEEKRQTARNIGGHIDFFGSNRSNSVKPFFMQGVDRDASEDSFRFILTTVAGGQRSADEDNRSPINQVKFFVSSGEISSGVFTLLGIPE